MNINGFIVDKYNIHNFKEGANKATCPKCRDSRTSKNKNKEVLLLNWDKGIGKCQHCGSHVQLHTYKRKGGDTRRSYNKPNPVWDEEISQEVLDYLSERGISKNTAIKAGVKSYKGKILFPYYIGGELTNIKTRTLGDDKFMHSEKGCELVLYNVDNTIGHDTVIICEGEMDALSIMEAGYMNVVSVPNGSKNLRAIDDCIGYLEDKTKFILSMDNDEAGKTLKDELVRRFTANKCLIEEHKDCKDANEFLVKYGVDELKDSIKNAIQVPIDNVLEFKDIEKEFDNFVDFGEDETKKTDLENLDKIFSLTDSTFCIVTGIPSMGKTTFMDQLIVSYNQKYGDKTLFASPENLPLKYHITEIYKKLSGERPTKENRGEERDKHTRSIIQENFFFQHFEDGFELTKVLDTAARVVMTKGINNIVIDPWNKIPMRDGPKRDSVNEYTSEYLRRIDIFCKKYKVNIFLIMHPNKQIKDKKGKYPIPSAYDIKGGGEVYDMSPNILVVHRDKEEEKVFVKVEKIKFKHQGKMGDVCEFTYDDKSGRLEPVYLPWENEEQ